MRTSIQIYNDDTDDMDTLEIYVTYDASGKARPATYWEPEEGFEIELKTITTLEGKCLDFQLNQEQENSILESCYDDLLDRHNDNYSGDLNDHEYERNE